MPGRYYFAPVRGESALHGVARGIEAGVQNLDYGLERRRQQGIEDEERGRRRLFEEFEIDRMLREQRGGRGDVPMASQPIEGVQFDPLSIGGGSQQATPMAPPRALPAPDPRYRPVGPEGFGYAMTPEALEEEDYQRTMGRAGRERDELLGRGGPAAQAIALARPGSPEFADAALRLSVDGFDPMAFIEPSYEPDRDDEFMLRGRDPGSGRSLDTRPDTSGGLPASTVTNWLDRRYGIWEVGEDGREYLAGHSIPDDELYEKTRAMTRGEDVDLSFKFGSTPDQERLFGLMMNEIEGSPSSAHSPTPRRDWGARAPRAESGAAPTSTAPASAGMATDDEVSQALEELQGLGVAAAELEEILLAEGATPDQIRRILGRP